MVPFYEKSGEPSDPFFYLHIRRLHLFGKHLEAPIYVELIIPSSQGIVLEIKYVFLFSRSIPDVLTTTADRVYHAQRAVELDISKDFNRFRHSRLFNRWQVTVYSGALLNWWNREMNGQSSTFFRTNVGDPEDSIFGLTLSLIFINDFPNDISSKIGIYTNDTTIFLPRW